MMIEHDPLRGIDANAVARDGARWSALLEAVAGMGGRFDPTGLYGVLRGLRACGASLIDATHGWRLDPPPDMGRDIMRREIGDHATLLAGLLRAAGDIRRAA